MRLAPYRPVYFTVPTLPDPLQKGSGRFIGWVLRDELALESPLEDGLTKASGTFEVGGDLAFNGLDE